MKPGASESWEGKKEESAAEPEDRAAQYAQRVERFQADCQRAARQSRNLSSARVVVFLLFAALLILAIESRRWSLIVPATSAAFLFVSLVWMHARVRRREAWLQALVQLNSEGLCRLAREWSGLPVRSAGIETRDHAFADDLDLYGQASLVQLLGPTPTSLGQARLDEWLLQPAAPHAIRTRQEAVCELGTQIDWRDTFAVHGRLTGAAQPGELETFLHWAEGKPWLSRQRFVLLLATLLPIWTWLFLGLHLFGVPNRWWHLTLALTLALWLVVARRIHRTFASAFSREAMLAHYSDLLRCIVEPVFQAPLLQEIQTKLKDGAAAHVALRRLERLMGFADTRFSSLHLPLQLLTLSDLHVLNALESWQTRHGHRVRGWLDSIGEVEALTALAALAHDQPEWTFPEINADAGRVEAEQLGHPLIADTVRVDNDITLGPSGSFVLITGSNMSGKSTMLRAIGLNIVLAQAGAPVCASKLRQPSIDLRTSIRVQDSLARGVSYFMAELQRLKSIVDGAAAPANGRVSVYLLDELLHGTNSAERRIAARQVIRRLVELGALGAVTTHDLDLVRDSELEPATHAVHFREHFRDLDGTTVMEFDYVLRPGVAPTTNALRLVELVGLGP